MKTKLHLGRGPPIAHGWPLAACSLPLASSWLLPSLDFVLPYLASSCILLSIFSCHLDPSVIPPCLLPSTLPSFLVVSNLASVSRFFPSLPLLVLLPLLPPCLLPVHVWALERAFCHSRSSSSSSSSISDSGGRSSVLTCRISHTDHAALTQARARGRACVHAFASRRACP